MWFFLFSRTNSVKKACSFLKIIWCVRYSECLGLFHQVRAKGAAVAVPTKLIPSLAAYKKLNPNLMDGLLAVDS